MGSRTEVSCCRDPQRLPGWTCFAGRWNGTPWRCGRLDGNADWRMQIGPVRRRHQVKTLRLLLAGDLTLIYGSFVCVTA